MLTYPYLEEQLQEDPEAEGQRPLTGPCDDHVKQATQHA